MCHGSCMMTTLVWGDFSGLLLLMVPITGGNWRTEELQNLRWGRKVANRLAVFHCSFSHSAWDYKQGLAAKLSMIFVATSSLWCSSSASRIKKDKSFSKKKCSFYLYSFTVSKKSIFNSIQNYHFKNQNVQVMGSF